MGTFSPQNLTCTHTHLSHWHHPLAQFPLAGVSETCRWRCELFGAVWSTLHYGTRSPHWCVEDRLDTPLFYTCKTHRTNDNGWNSRIIKIKIFKQLHSLKFSPLLSPDRVWRAAESCMRWEEISTYQKHTGCYGEAVSGELLKRLRTHLIQCEEL